MSDNTTAIHCIKKMGTSNSMECHHQVLKIWGWAIIHKNHLSTAYIPGKVNKVADKESQSNHVNTESGIRTFMFQNRSRSICNQY